MPNPALRHYQTVCFILFGTAYICGFFSSFATLYHKIVVRIGKTQKEINQIKSNPYAVSWTIFGFQCGIFLLLHMSLMFGPMTRALSTSRKLYYYVLVLIIQMIVIWEANDDNPVNLRFVVPNTILWVFLTVQASYDGYKHCIAEKRSDGSADCVCDCDCIQCKPLKFDSLRKKPKGIEHDVKGETVEHAIDFAEFAGM